MTDLTKEYDRGTDLETLNAASLSMTSVQPPPSFVAVVSKSGVDTQHIHALNLPLAQVQAKMTGAVSALGGEPLVLSTIAIQAALYHLKAQGQQVRARIALGACRTLNVETTDAVTLAAAIELLHNASLVHDDLQDRDLERRGQQTVWSKYGDNTAICVGDLLLSCSYGVLAQYRDASVLGALVTLMHTRTAQAVRGQNADLVFQNKTSPDLNIYKQIVIAKSGALLSLPLELALIAGGHSASCKTALKAAQAFSMGYQIIDDLDDYQSDQLRATAKVLNVLQVLNGANNILTAQAQARQLAREHLFESIGLADTLPMGSGSLLIQIAKKLLARLE